VDDAVAHLCDVTQTHHTLAPDFTTNGWSASSCRRSLLENYQVEFVVVLHTPTLQRISGGNCGDQVAEAQSVRVKTMWVGQHLDFATALLCTVTRARPGTEASRGTI